MQLADNLSRQKSHMFKIWPEWTIPALIAKKTIFDLLACLTHVSDRCP